MAVFETRIPDRLSFPDALARVLASTPPLPPASVALLEAEGRAAAEDQRSSLTLPPGPTSHMDGYALHSSDLARFRQHGRELAPLLSLPVIGRSLPGAPFPGPLSPGAAIRIMTGALLPIGADTVVPVEETDRGNEEEGVVRIRVSALPATPLEGRHLRPAGEEAREGELLASAGDSLDYRLLAHLGAAGIEELSAHPIPRVSLLITGSELVDAGNLAALDGGIRRADILSPALTSLIRRSGGTVSRSIRAGDDPESLRSAIRTLQEDCDLLVTTGGASMGEADLVKDILLEEGGRLDFWGIRMRPGSPVSLIRIPRGDGATLPVLGLPGNPVSAIVTFAVLGIPALRSLGGHRKRGLRTLTGTVRAPLPGPGPAHLTRFPRIRIAAEGKGEWGVYPAGEEGSGVIRGISHGDGVAVLPEGRPKPLAGEAVEVLLLPGAEWMEQA